MKRPNSKPKRRPNAQNRLIRARGTHARIPFAQNAGFEPEFGVGPHGRAGGTSLAESEQRRPCVRGRSRTTAAHQVVYECGGDGLRTESTRLAAPGHSGHRTRPKAHYDESSQHIICPPTHPPPLHCSGADPFRCAEKALVTHPFDAPTFSPLSPDPATGASVDKLNRNLVSSFTEPTTPSPSGFSFHDNCQTCLFDAAMPSNPSSC